MRECVGECLSVVLIVIEREVMMMLVLFIDTFPRNSSLLSYYDFSFPSLSPSFARDIFVSLITLSLCTVPPDLCYKNNSNNIVILLYIRVVNAI